MELIFGGQQFNAYQIKPNQVTSHQMSREKHFSSTECTLLTNSTQRVWCKTWRTERKRHWQKASILTTAPALLPVPNMSVFADKCHPRKIKMLLVLKFFIILLNTYMKNLQNNRATMHVQIDQNPAVHYTSKLNLVY